jgi:thioredoxin-related protein
MKNLTMVMRKLLVLVCLFAGMQSFGIQSDTAQRINFHTKGLQAVFKKAKTEHKLVFILVESKHCAVCRRLDRDLGKGGEYSAVFNENFCSYKVYADDMLKQFQAQNWGVTKVPTMIFMNENHKIVHFAEGYNDIIGLTAEAKKAINTSTNTLTSK